jgi:hypothetical protein
MLTIVARPIGNVPRKRLWVGWRIMAPHISGYTLYRTIEIKRKRMKRPTFKQKTTTEM